MRPEGATGWWRWTGGHDPGWAADTSQDQGGQGEVPGVEIPIATEPGVERLRRDLESIAIAARSCGMESPIGAALTGPPSAAW